jgi:hemolysin activation/secretion protein
LGGLAGVRGYREGEVFGDSGWRVSVEQKTPPHVVGMAYGKAPLSVRGSVYIDYGEDYLLDPNGRDGNLRLWGIGAGAVATIGNHFDARLLVTFPLLGTTTTDAGHPRFDFTLTAEF